MATKPINSNLDVIKANTIIERIIFGRDGNQVRTVINGARKSEPFAYPSRRFRRGHFGEGQTELNLVMISESKADRLDFLPQPCVIEARVYGERRSAIPDAAYVDIGKPPCLVECKSRWELFELPKAIIQRAITECGAAALKWDYERVTSTSQGSPEFLDTVEEVQAYRFIDVPIRIEKAFRRALTEHDTLQLGEIASSIGVSIGHATALASSLMVTRVVAIDLSSPLSERSILRLAPKRPFAFPSIRR